MAAQAGLSLTWSKIPKTGFLVTRLILFKSFYMGRMRTAIMMRSIMTDTLKHSKHLDTLKIVVTIAVIILKFEYCGFTIHLCARTMQTEQQTE